MGKWLATNVGEVCARKVYQKMDVMNSTKPDALKVVNIEYNKKHDDYVITWSNGSIQTARTHKVLLVWKEN